MTDTDVDPSIEISILAEIGLITLKWNDLEQRLEHLIWYYLGDQEKGHIVTGTMQNLARLNVLRALCECTESIPDLKDHVSCFAAAFDVLRLNRNSIVHSVSYGLNHKGDKFLFERLKKQVRTREFDTIALPLAALQKLTDQIVDLTSYGETLHGIMQKRSGLLDQNLFAWPKPPAWPEKFPLPKKLSSLRQIGQ